MSFNYGGQSYDSDGLPIDPRRKSNEDIWKSLSHNDGSSPQASPYGGNPRPTAFQSRAEASNPYAQQQFAAMNPQAPQNLPTNAVPPYARQMQYSPMTPPKSQIAAALLALFLGEFGVHNFYLGYTRRGTIQLAMFVFGFISLFILIGFPILIGLGIWAFVEFILILLRSGQYGFDANGRPLE